MFDSVALDRHYRRLRVLIPRGWTFIAMFGLTPYFVLREPNTAEMGISIGGILLVYGAFTNLIQGLEHIAGAIIAWKRVRPFWEVARADRNIVDRTVRFDERAIKSDVIVECKNVSFRYPGRVSRVFTDVDLKIKNGDQVLLQGDSGGGKSTLGKLLAAMQTPESGLILCGGHDRQSLGDDFWRRRIVLAPQFHENHVLQGTFTFNLMLGRSWPVREADLLRATMLCRRLGLGPLLDRMPAGMHQMVGETGWQLSQGERSRLFLARAILQSADLTILDEVVGALDPETLCNNLTVVLDEIPSLLLIAHP